MGNRARKKSREAGGHLEMSQTALEENLQMPDSKRANSGLDLEVGIGGAPSQAPPGRTLYPVQ